MDFVLAHTDRGFERIEFTDAYDKKCHIQQSSAIDDTDRGLQQPGSSFLWLGVNDAEPMILARDAPKHGLDTNKTTGWIPYPIPDCVLLHTHMHLNREQVAALIPLMKNWLDTGSLK